jgi:hypothetical protein
LVTSNCDYRTADDNKQSIAGRAFFNSRSACRARLRPACPQEFRQTKVEAPSTYEAEGASRFCSSSSLTARPALSVPTPRPLVASRTHGPLSAARPLGPPKRPKRPTRERSPILRSARAADPPVHESSPIAQPAELYGTRQRRIRASLDEHRSTRCPPPQKAPSRGRLARWWTICELRGPDARLRELPTLVARRFWGFPRNPVTISGGVRNLYAQLAAPRKSLAGVQFKILHSSTDRMTLPPCESVLSTGCPPARPHRVPHRAADRRVPASSLRGRCEPSG